MTLTRETWDRIWPLAERAARDYHREHGDPFDKCPRTICVYHRHTLQMIQRELDELAAAEARLPAANAPAEPTEGHGT